MAQSAILIITNPGVTRSDVTQPGVTLPSVTESDLTPLGVTQPDVTQPGVMGPDVTQPGVTQPNVTEQGTTKLEVKHPTDEPKNTPRSAFNLNDVNRIVDHHNFLRLRSRETTD